MADADVQLQPDGSGKLVDCAELSGTPGNVYRQRVSIGDDTTYGAHAGVANSNPAASAYGLVTRPLNLSYAQTYQVTLTPLLASATFTQTAIDQGDLTSGGPAWSHWRVFYASDQIVTVNMEQSADNSTWDITNPVSVSAGASGSAEDRIVLRYLRLVATCGLTNQTYFRLHLRLVST